MKVEIENGKLAAAGNFLYGLKSVRKQSRMRRRLIALLDEKNKTYLEDKKALQEEHAEKDEKDKPIIIDNVYDIKDMKAFSKDLSELNEEVFVIDGGDNREMIRTVKEFLKKFEEEEYEGQESEIYDYLCDQFDVDSVEEVVKDAGNNNGN